MKILLILTLISVSAFAKDSLTNFNQDLMEKFDKDMRSDNDLRIKKKPSPSRGPASVAPEAVHVREEKKIDKTVRQTGLQDW